VHHRRPQRGFRLKRLQPRPPCRDLRAAGIPTTYDEQAAIGKRYHRQDEIGAPWCLTVNGDTAKDNTVTLHDRDSLEQVRIPVKDVTSEIQRRLRG
jgi:glycyl-tRNA synthetase